MDSNTIARANRSPTDEPRAGQLAVTPEYITARPGQRVTLTWVLGWPRRRLGTLKIPMLRIERGPGNLNAYDILTGFSPIVENASTLDEFKAAYGRENIEVFPSVEAWMRFRSFDPVDVIPPPQLSTTYSPATDDNSAASPVGVVYRRAPPSQSQNYVAQDLTRPATAYSPSGQGDPSAPSSEQRRKRNVSEVDTAEGEQTAEVPIPELLNASTYSRWSEERHTDTAVFSWPDANAKRAKQLGNTSIAQSADGGSQQTRYGGDQPELLEVLYFDGAAILFDRWKKIFALCAMDGGLPTNINKRLCYNVESALSRASERTNLGHQTYIKLESVMIHLTLQNWPAIRSLVNKSKIQVPKSFVHATYSDIERMHSTPAGRQEMANGGQAWVSFRSFSRKFSPSDRGVRSVRSEARILEEVPAPLTPIRPHVGAVTMPAARPLSIVSPANRMLPPPSPRTASTPDDGTGTRTGSRLTNDPARNTTMAGRRVEKPQEVPGGNGAEGELLNAPARRTRRRPNISISSVVAEAIPRRHQAISAQWVMKDLERQIEKQRTMDHQAVLRGGGGDDRSSNQVARHSGAMSSAQEGDNEANLIPNGTVDPRNTVLNGGGGAQPEHQIPRNTMLKGAGEAQSQRQGPSTSRVRRSATKGNGASYHEHAVTSQQDVMLYQGIGAGIANFNREAARSMTVPPDYTRERRQESNPFAEPEDMSEEEKEKVVRRFFKVDKFNEDNDRGNLDHPFRTERRPERNSSDTAL